jgi:hypothetical protein
MDFRSISAISSSFICPLDLFVCWQCYSRALVDLRKITISSYQPSIVSTRPCQPRSSTTFLLYASHLYNGISSPSRYSLFISNLTWVRVSRSQSAKTTSNCPIPVQTSLSIISSRSDVSCSQQAPAFGLLPTFQYPSFLPSFASDSYSRIDGRD